MVLPFNCLLFAAENLVFLVFPMRPAAVGPGDFQVLGRQIVTHALRRLIVVIGVQWRIGFGMVAYRLASKSLPWLTIVVSVLLLAEASRMLPAMAWPSPASTPAATRRPRNALSSHDRGRGPIDPGQYRSCSPPPAFTPP